MESPVLEEGLGVEEMTEARVDGGKPPGSQSDGGVVEYP